MDSASGGPRSVDTEWESSPQVSSNKRDDDEAVGSSADWPQPVIANSNNRSIGYGSSVGTTSSVAMEPVDRFNVVYIIFYVMGVGSLLPWNIFTNARQYFLFKLRNTNLTVYDDYTNPNNETELQIMFEGYLAVAAMLPNVLFMFLNTVVAKIIAVNLRVVTSIAMMIIMFILTVVLVHTDTDKWQVMFFATTLMTVVIMNAFSAVFQGGVFGLSGKFPASYTQAIMAGQAMGGTIAACLNILSLTMFEDVRNSALWFFIIATFVLFVSLVGYLSLPKNRFARYYSAERANRQPFDVNTNSNVLENDEAPCSESLPLISKSISTSNSPNLWIVFRRIWMYGLSVMSVFMVTLACYPAVTSSIMPFDYGKDHSIWKETYFTPVTCFLFFNLGDLIGRTIAGFLQYPREGSMWLMVLCFLRIGFIPLFLMCNVQPRASLPVWFEYDVYPVLFQLLFALSNGYLATLCMMYGPLNVLGEDLETAGAMMSFFLSAGLSLGSCLSVLLMMFVKVT